MVSHNQGTGEIFYGGKRLNSDQVISPQNWVTIPLDIEPSDKRIKRSSQFFQQFHNKSRTIIRGYLHKRLDLYPCGRRAGSSG